MKLEQLHVTISGRVQGVGFRYSTRSKAERLGISGWVKNLSDGSVEIFAEGTTEQIGFFFEWCEHWPSQSKVEKVNVHDRSNIETKGFMSFEIVY